MGIGVSDGERVAVLLVNFVELTVILGLAVNMTVGVIEFPQDVVIIGNNKRKMKTVFVFILTSYGNP